MVVDANIWISSLMKLPFRDRTEVFFDSENLLLVSEELFDELDDAIRKPYPERRIVRIRSTNGIFSNSSSVSIRVL